MTSGVYKKTKKYKRNLSKIMKIVMNKPEIKAKISESIKRLRKDPNSIFNSDAYKAKRIESAKTAMNRPEVKAKMKKTHNLPEVKMKHSRAQKNKYKDPKERKKQSERMKKVWQDPNSVYNSYKYKMKHKESLKIALNRPETKEKFSKGKLKLWQNPDFREKIKTARHLKPNNLEQFFDKITPDNVRYVGDFNFWIITKKGSKNPDFKITRQKKVIELFGDYWHKDDDPKELIKLYKKAGYKCIIFWEWEIYKDTERVLKETLEFIK